MADTTSIASRMEKLAQLKRMKQGLSSAKVDEPVAVDAETQAEPTISAPEEIHAPDPMTAAFEPEKTEFQPPVSDEFEPISPEIDDDMIAAFDTDMSAPENQEDTEVSADIPETADVKAAVEAEADLESEIPEDLMEIEDDFAPSSDMAEDVSAPAESVSADLDLDEDTQSALEEIAAIAGVGGVATAVVASQASDETEEQADPAAEMPDYTSEEVPADLLEREFENDSPQIQETAAVSETEAAAVAEESADDRVTLTFDESRSTLLNHVSRQMDCTVDDVVVTALDWYLDALFGEDEEAKSA